MNILKWAHSANSHISSPGGAVPSDAARTRLVPVGPSAGKFLLQSLQCASQGTVLLALLLFSTLTGQFTAEQQRGRVPTLHLLTLTTAKHFSCLLAQWVRNGIALWF